MCKSHKDRNRSRKERDPIAVVRKMGKRNYHRHEVPDGHE